MVKVAAGGGSGAAAWAGHAACERFRNTDPMATGLSRRALAAQLGHPDVSAGIPDARWTRAMIFERLCHNEAFAGEVAARALGWSGFSRPQAVVTADCRTQLDRTRETLERAAATAHEGVATLLSRLAVPFPGLGSQDVTNVFPDLAVVGLGPHGPMLVVGDVKDYERVRSRIDDGRMLKGFLQVALGAYAFTDWGDLPAGLTVSTHGFLAVPRSAFLQPTVQVENLRDHLDEVRAQVEARKASITAAAAADLTAATAFVAAQVAEFDPATCPSCSLHGHCRAELRSNDDPTALLREIGVPPQEWQSLLPLVNGATAEREALPSTVARVRATTTGRAIPTGRRRLDPVGETGTVNVVVVKSDAAALGFHGLGVSRVGSDGPTPWEFVEFDDPQDDKTRRDVMNRIGRAVQAAMADARSMGGDVPAPIHVVVPDRATADLLASTADLLAGVEISRLRWQRDQDMGRPLLTFDGEKATMPKRLEGARRVAVSFLLEQDRARMLRVRNPIVDLTALMSAYWTVGGAAVSALRLDYVTAWVREADGVDHRSVTDDVERRTYTPGARLGNDSSNAIHRARLDAAKDGDWGHYRQLVREELEYRARCVDDALAALATVPVSHMQPAYRSFEGAAQEVWRRRMRMRASDLVRFGRTYRHWRDQLVDVISSDGESALMVELLTDPTRAEEVGRDAGNRNVATAEVVSTSPLALAVPSHRVAAGTRWVLLTVAGRDPWVESEGVEVTVQKGSIRLKGFPVATLEAPEDLLTGDVPAGALLWEPRVNANVEIGDVLVLADVDLFTELQRPAGALTMGRPRGDSTAAPSAGCLVNGYADNPSQHQWCCKPHEAVEAEFADELALRRARKELNPEVWPPVRNEDGFEVTPDGKPTSRDVSVPEATAPEGVTVDELE